MHILNKILIKLFAQYVGSDEFGNHYYERSSRRRNFNKASRYVIYNGEVEGSKVSPKWFKWLHCQAENPPRNQKKYPWIKTYKPNLSGTVHAYYPDGHYKSGKHKENSFYEPWSPAKK